MQGALLLHLHSKEGHALRRGLLCLLRDSASGLLDCRAPLAMTRSDSPARSEADAKRQSGAKRSGREALKGRPGLTPMLQRRVIIHCERSEAAVLSSLRVIARHEAIQKTNIPMQNSTPLLLASINCRLMVWATSFVYYSLTPGLLRRASSQ